MNRTVNQITELLTPEQLDIWNSLTGKPVDFDLPSSPNEFFIW